jgi:Holliday junction resolvase
MRYRAKVDVNQAEIVAALRKVGRSVIHLSTLGKGIPDLLVSNGSEMWLVEVKNPDVKGYKNEYTEDQKDFYIKWKGKPIVTVYTVDEAIEKTT